MTNAVIVIPCYNEEHRLKGDVFADFANENPHVRFLFVNDGSTDRTDAILRATAERLPQSLRVSTLAKNIGKAEAVRHGLLAACAMKADVVGFWDADLATPLHDIVNFIGVLDQRPDIEWVFGARVNLLGRNVKRSLFRHYSGRLSATLIDWALRIGVYDTQCGAKVFRNRPWLIERLQEPFMAGWIFDVEMIAREIQARRDGSDPKVSDIIYEYPLESWHDVAGSKLKPLDWFKMNANLARIWWHYLL